MLMLGAESDTSSLVTAIINVTAPSLDIVQVKLSSLKSVVNEFPCLKSQGEFLKVPVANVANMFNQCQPLFA